MAILNPVCEILKVLFILPRAVPSFWMGGNQRAQAAFSGGVTTRLLQAVVCLLIAEGLGKAVLPRYVNGQRENGKNTSQRWRNLKGGHEK